MSVETATIEKILSELRVISQSPISPKIISEIPEIPSWISAGDGKSLIINRAISSLISDLAGQLYAARPSLSKAITANDWSSNVRRALGPILGNTDLDVLSKISAVTILTSLNKELDGADWNYKSRTFIFGCSFVQNHNISPFRIGPVTIFSRLHWLENALQEKRISSITHRRLRALWTGKKTSPRKISIDSLNEDYIADTIGAAPYVCAVQTDGLFGEFAKEKALTAARLSLIGVALMWARPSKALEDINLIYDGPAYRQNYVYFQDRPEAFGGSKWVNLLHGVSLFSETWEPLVADHQSWWNILAEIIQFLLSSNAQVARPRLMNSLAHALIWFHEACREPMPIIAITKYMSSLDALACGGGDHKISKLISARLGVNPKDPIRPGGLSFERSIKELYSQGRSRLLHGTSDRIFADWENSRRLSETFARIGLVTCFEWATNNPNCDIPSQMVKP